MPKPFYENDPTGLKHVLSNQVIHNLKTGNLMLDHFINLPKIFFLIEMEHNLVKWMQFNLSKGIRTMLGNA